MHRAGDAIIKNTTGKLDLILLTILASFLRCTLNLCRNGGSTVSRVLDLLGVVITMETDLNLLLLVTLPHNFVLTLATGTMNVI